MRWLRTSNPLKKQLSTAYSVGKVPKYNCIKLVGYLLLTPLKVGTVPTSNPLKSRYGTYF